MADIESLDESIANGVRAGAVVSTMSQAVQELLSNSIDAGASCIEIKVDLPAYRLSVSDNGRGIPAEKLHSLVATARATSKATSAEEMQHACTYGFRGEALYSLGLTSLLEIQSRCVGKQSHAKVVRAGQTVHFGPGGAPLRNGTIVTLRDAFFKWPVRRKAANEGTELLRIKELVGRIALVNNSVAVTVVDSAKSKALLKTPATGSLTRTFAHLFSSDKLSMARKLSFEFKQFRLTGYLSPPSSTACHWSKEFQFVYVNRRCVRRLGFLHKIVNTAFGPCMALLGGRGGADGQAVVRRVRDPNASSGQRQELFPVFVLNIECPSGEVDVTTEPDKTWVEFSDWPAVKNACIAMLLAFLPHFEHAVPTTVLRDLRRAFHRNEGEDARMASSPPRSTAARTARATPEAVPTPSPSPMRLRAPEVGMPSPLHSCVWMGRDRGSPGLVDEGGEAMAYEVDGFRAEGFLYPSPASRFGARNNTNDNGPARYGSDSITPSGKDIAIDVSPHFSNDQDGSRCRQDGRYSRRERRRSDRDGWDTNRVEAHQTGGSPYFTTYDRRYYYSGRRQDNVQARRRRRLALERLNGGGGGGRGAGLDYDRDSGRQGWGEEGGVGTESRECVVVGEGVPLDGAVGGDGGGGGYVRGEAGGWPAESPDLSSRTKLPHPTSLGYGFSAYGPPNTDLVAVAGGRRRAAVSPGPSIAPRVNGKREWLRYVPGVAEEMRAGVAGAGVESADDVELAKNERGLSRLFDYAFVGNDSRQEIEETVGEIDDPSRGDNGNRGRNPGRGNAGTTKGALKWGQDSRRSRLAPPSFLPGGSGSVTGTPKKALVGVSVRRRRSPQFSFMNERSRKVEDAAPLCPPARPDPLDVRQPEETTGACVVADRRPRETRGGAEKEEWSQSGGADNDETEITGESAAVPWPIPYPETREDRHRTAAGDVADGRRETRGGAEIGGWSEKSGGADNDKTERPGATDAISWRVPSPETRENYHRTGACDIADGGRRETHGGAKKDGWSKKSGNVGNHETEKRPGVATAVLWPVPSPETREDRHRTGPSLRMQLESGGTACSPGVDAVCTPPRPMKRRRPETWEGGSGRRSEPLSASPPVPPPVGRSGMVVLQRADEALKHGSPGRRGKLARSPGDDDDDDGVGLGGGWLGWTRGGRRLSRQSWWGTGADDTPEGGAVLEVEGSTEGFVGERGGAVAGDGCDAAAETDAGSVRAQGNGGGSCGALEQERFVAKQRSPDDALKAEKLEGTSRSQSNARDNTETGGQVDGDPGRSGAEHQLPREGEEDNIPDFGTVLGARSSGVADDRGGSGNGSGGSGEGGANSAVNVRGSSREDAALAEDDAALAYDQDVLGGDGVVDAAMRMGAAEREAGDDPLRNVLGNFLTTEAFDSCEVSDPGGGAVYSPREPGGSQARGKLGGDSGKADKAAEAFLRAGEKPISEVVQAGQDEVGAGAGAVAVTVTPEELRLARVIGQAGRKFILLRAGTGALLCVDQHAADERVKLEELERQVYGAARNTRNINKLVLSPPEVVPVTGSDAELLEQHRRVLESWRFVFEVTQAKGGGDCGAPSATLLAVPVVCGVRLSVQDLVGFLHHLRECVEPGASARWLRPPQVQHILNYKACHSAIRFGDSLTRLQCVELIRKLAVCARPFCCAHGRPSVVPICVLGEGASANRSSLRGNHRASSAQQHRRRRAPTSSGVK